MRVLVIDDEEHVRGLVRLLLEEAGCQVTEASNGEEGLQAFHQSPADRVLCDLWMPGKDGLETILELSREFPGVRIIAMSGGAPGSNVDLLPVALQLGAAAFLHKPFVHEELLAAVR